jgi:hypothetical protein
MKKDECEKALRYLCHEWRRKSGLDDTPAQDLSFEAYYSWVQQHYSLYLDFRTTSSVRYDAEMWFDQVFKQTWRR